MLRGGGCAAHSLSQQLGQRRFHLVLFKLISTIYG